MEKELKLIRNKLAKRIEKMQKQLDYLDSDLDCYLKEIEYVYKKEKIDKRSE